MITRATQNDEATIQACAEQAYSRYIPLIGKRPAPMDADYAAQIEAGQVYVYRAEDQSMMGFIVFHPEDGDMMLENVAVFPDAAGHGVKRLIQFCESAAKTQKFKSVLLYTNERRSTTCLSIPGSDMLRPDGSQSMVLTAYISGSC